MDSWNARKTMWGRGLTENWRLALDRHPLNDAFWDSKRPNLAAIEIPAYVVASWTDHGIHTRGTLEGFTGIRSAHRFLEVHGRKKWSRYYWPESVSRQLAFFDRYLKGIPNEVDGWPPVRIEVRERHSEGQWRDERAWPLPSTRYVPYFLDAAAGTLAAEPPAHAACVSYDSGATGTGARFDLTFTEDTEVTGYALAKLWVSLDDGAVDGDLFAALQKVDASGAVVNFPYFTLQDDGQAAHGWQRVSHRELDPARIPGQPVRPHRRELPVPEGEVVEVQVEFWPSSTLFRTGGLPGRHVRRRPPPASQLGDAHAARRRAVRRPPAAAGHRALTPHRITALGAFRVPGRGRPRPGTSPVTACEGRAGRSRWRPWRRSR
jgi:predicted acyl esterase